MEIHDSSFFTIGAQESDQRQETANLTDTSLRSDFLSPICHECKNVQTESIIHEVGPFQYPNYNSNSGNIRDGKFFSFGCEDSVYFSKTNTPSLTPNTQQSS